MAEYLQYVFGIYHEASGLRAPQPAQTQELVGELGFY